ncbi:MAG: excinuclease ABC subunit UvrC [Lachnospiraceae bacterium]|nr:excinuclease ABC subunit UvrC [Lachnospiraceae bacterium]
MREFDLKKELKQLPNRPGVYLMHDANDEIIYVGKAKILKNRVKQYFQTGVRRSSKIELMVARIAWFEYIVVDSELEALVLENNLIKEHAPKYNTMLKDGKTYPYIKVTVGEDYPRVLLTREQKKDKARYFGPYALSGSINEMIELIRKLFRIRTCNRNLPKDIGKERPCLYYQIGQCDAPCADHISKEDYRASVERVIRFLSRDYDDVLKMLKNKMLAASGKLEFEKAAEYRDLMARVEALHQEQKADDSVTEERDIIASASEGNQTVIAVFFERNGRLVGREHHYLEQAEQQEPAAYLGEFLKQFYDGMPYIPKEISMETEPEDRELIEEWLTKKRGRAVHIRIPKIGGKEHLVALARQNAQMVLKQDLEKIAKEEKRTKGAAAEIAALLSLTDVHRMESYDISNISGFLSVGSMVVFQDGAPRKSEYRKFRIKSVEGPNDYASMEEMLTRRFRHGMEEREQQKESSFTRYPDLILMDGGKGQVHVAEEVLKNLGLSIPVAGMVKDDNHRTRGLYFRDEELPINTHGEGFALLTRIQDETHRFAIEYHKGLRSKQQIRSGLLDIPGIGPTRQRTLMRYFDSMESLRNAKAEELSKLPGMNRKAAEEIVAFFAKKE